jgi:adenylate cyclase
MDAPLTEHRELVTEHRELALMFSDIVGYSRLMGRDEALTIEMLGDYRKILLAHIEEHSGVFIEFAGDAIFARFDTSCAAVNAAIAIQKHLQLFNQGRDKELPRLQTRIGIHKGEVVLRDSAVLGDDVNIAARLEPLAVADGICVSKTVYDDIRLELREPVKPLGVQALKNIEQKIRVYLIKPTGLGWRDHMHYFWQACTKKIFAYRYPLTAMLISVIVAGFYFIPRWLVPGYTANYVEIANFQNLMNANGESDYFSAGITEAVRSQLADTRDVYIVESEKGIHAPVKLEGSVQKIGDNLRIVYRLFRREGNVQIAGGKLDGAYQDIFILQDRLVGEIAKYLAKEFKLKNFRPAPLKLTADITAYDYYLQGMEYLGKPYSQENFDDAIQRFSQALVHDSQFALANSGLCDAYRLKNQLRKSGLLIEKAESHCLKALVQDENSTKVYASLGALYRDTGKYAEAVKYLQQAKEKDPDNVSTAIALARTYDLMQDEVAAESIYLDAIARAPKNWLAYQGYGYFLIRKGRHDEAIKNYDKVLNLTPENASTLNNIGTAYLYKGEFKKAAQSLERATEIEPRGNLFLNAGSMYYFSGDFESAVKMYQQALRLEPDNVEFLVGIADAYFFLQGMNSVADEYFKKAQLQAEVDIKSNPGVVSGYQVIAMASIHFGEGSQAKKIMDIAEKMDSGNVNSHYVRLRISVKEGSEIDMRTYASKLLAGGYSEKLILADPYFAILKETRFQDIFVK